MPDVKATLINSNPQEVSVEDWAEICYELFSLVLANSPVDTGAFVASWELNQIADDIWEIYNPIGYASFLEDGWSGQAPRGVLDPAIERLPNIMRKVIGKKPTGEVYVSVQIPDYIPKQ